MAEGDIRAIGFKWSVKQFSSSEGKTYIRSKTWSLDGNTWELVLYPNGENVEDQGFISLYIKRCTNKISYINFSISIINMFNEKCCTVSEKKTAQRTDYMRYGSVKFISRKELVEKGLLVDDKLEIFCTMSTEELTELDQTFEVLLDEDDLQLKLDDEDTTVLVKSQKFKVHRSILSVQSNVFAAMFRHKMKESSTSTVIIEDFEPAVFQEFLRFVYLNKIRKLTDVEYRELYACADKYSVDGLKIVCRKSIRNSMSVFNVVDIFLLADRYKDESLKEDSLKFIKTFPKTITAKSGWISIHSHPELMELIITSLAEEITSDRLLSI